MALSNWDVLAFDENAEPCNGAIESVYGGATAAIYKNRLDVTCKAAWQGGKGFTGDIIARIEHGSISLLDFEVVAIRGPQKSIIVCVESKKWSSDDGDIVIRRMAGIGAYGFNDPIGEWIDELGIELGPKDDYLFGSSYDSAGKYEGPEFKTLDIHREGGGMETYKVPWSEAMAKRLVPQWVGVLPETVTEMIRFLRDFYDDDREGLAWADKIEKAKPLRVNQGDMFFAKHLGVDPQATPPGETKTSGPDTRCT